MVQDTIWVQDTNILERASPGETSLTSMPLSNSPDYRVNHKENRRQHTWVQYGCQGHKALDQTVWEEA